MSTVTSDTLPFSTERYSVFSPASVSTVTSRLSVRPLS